MGIISLGPGEQPLWHNEMLLGGVLPDGLQTNKSSCQVPRATWTVSRPGLRPQHTCQESVGFPQADRFWLFPHIPRDQTQLGAPCPGSSQIILSAG